MRWPVRNIEPPPADQGNSDMLLRCSSSARKRPVPMPLFSGIESTKVDVPVVVPDRRIELASPKHTAHIAAGNVRSEIATTMLHRRLIGHFP
jgi:hypothetical protein